MAAADDRCRLLGWVLPDAVWHGRLAKGTWCFEDIGASPSNIFISLGFRYIRLSAPGSILSQRVSNASKRS